MTQERMPREADTRMTRERPKVWQPAAALPEPDMVAGYTYRWVRVSALGKADPKNVSAKLREGWEPVRVEEQPQFKMFLDPDSQFKDNIEIGGLLLCKIPDEFVGQVAERCADVLQMGGQVPVLEELDDVFLHGEPSLDSSSRLATM